MDFTVDYSREWFEANAPFFEAWYSPITFRESQYDFLAVYCSDHIKDWIDHCPKMSISYELSSNCQDYFDLWFDAYTFDWNDDTIGNLNHYCDHRKDVWLPYATLIQL